MFKNKIVIQDMDNIVSSNVNWEKLRDSTVLITGAGGMIASYIIYTLLYLNDIRNMNIMVLGLVRNREKAELHFSELLERKDFLLLVQDVCLPLSYDGAVDYIIHAASQASPRHFVQDPSGTIFANTIGSIRMLDLAVEKKSKSFLYLSTREIYGKPLDSKEFITEDDYGTLDPTLVRSCYPESKRMSETLCASYKHQYDLNCKIARIAHTYGPGITIGDGRVVGDFIEKIISSKAITLNSDGSTFLGLTYLSDLVQGLFLVLLNFNDLVYNVSNHNVVITVKELAEKLASMYPDRKIDVSFQIKPESERMGYLSHKVGLLQSDKAIMEGWTPVVGIEEGFRRTIEFFSRES